MIGHVGQAEEILYGQTAPRRPARLMHSPSGYWVAEDDQLRLPVTSELLEWLRSPGQDQDEAADQLDLLRFHRQSQIFNETEAGSPLILEMQLDVIDDGVEATMSDGSRQLLITTNSTIWLMHEQFGTEGSIPALCRHLPELRPLDPEEIFTVHGVIGYGSDPNAT